MKYKLLITTEETEDLKNVLNASETALILWEIYNEARSATKHGDGEEHYYQALERIKDLSWSSTEHIYRKPSLLERLKSLFRR